MNVEERDKIKDLLKALSEKLKKPENKDLLDDFLLNCGVFRNRRYFRFGFCSFTKAGSTTEITCLL